MADVAAEWMDCLTYPTATPKTISAFSGADVRWMRAAREHSYDENVDDARAMAAMFNALDTLPCAVIGKVHGPALGGGVGLVAVCDIVVAERATVFGFSEVRLGIVPAGISTFVVRKIGPAHGRAPCMSAPMVATSSSARSAPPNRESSGAKRWRSA